MEAKATNLLHLLSFQKVEGIQVGEVSCSDYDHYKGLPDVIECQGFLMCKTGWNSDHGIAYYQTGRLTGTPHLKRG